MGLDDCAGAPITTQWRWVLRNAAERTLCALLLISGAVRAGDSEAVGHLLVIHNPLSAGAHGDFGQWAAVMGRGAC